MTLLIHELKQNRLSLLIWTAAISFMLGICVIIYPEMSSQMGDISEMFSDMGSFSAAFGMDQINFGEFSGYFAVECGNVLGMGGAFFASIIAISALAKEEKEHTAEFLLAHPISRRKVVTMKLSAVLLQLIILNAVVIGITTASIAIIGEEVSIKTLGFLFLAYFLLQIEIAGITFGISAFLKNGGLGIGLGLAILFYFMNILANLTEEAKFLKYITPFSYAEGTDIITNGSIKSEYLVIGMILTIISIATAYLKYCRKDIA